MRWRYEGKRYSLTLFPNTNKGLHYAKKHALEIESDIESLYGMQNAILLEQVLSDLL